MNEKAWWEEENENYAAQSLYEYTKGIAEDQTNYQRYYDLRHARLYSNRYYHSLRGVSYGIQKESITQNQSYSTRLNRNVIKSCVDSIVAKVAKTAVRPRFLTNAGDSRAQTKAQKGNKYIQGLFYQTKIPEKAPLVLRDACIFGTGIMKHFIEPVPGEKKKFRIQSMRVMPDEIVVDPADAYYQNPKSIMQVSFPSKKALIQLFPDKVNEILHADAEDSYISVGYQKKYLEVVMCIEGFALPSPGKPGRRIMTVGGKCLIDEAWPFDFFPYSIMRYSEPLYGFYGTGIAEELTGVQLEINRLMISIQKSMYLLARPKIFYQDGSINTRLYNNEEGGFIPVSGSIFPQVVSPNAIPSGAFQQIELYTNIAYKSVGLSEMSATSSVPAKLSSARAIIEARDLETERFSQTVHVFENFHIDAANKQLELVRFLGEKGLDYQVSSFDRQQGMEILSWKDVSLDKNGYVMQCYPTSALPDSPVGKLNFIETLAQSGAIPPEEVRSLLDFPDLDESEKLYAAGQKNLKKNLDKIMMGEEADLPEDTDDLNYAKRLVTQYKALARLNDLSDEVLDSLDTYQEYVDFLILQASAPPPQMPGQIPPEMGVPGALPPGGMESIPPEVLQPELEAQMQELSQ